MGDKRWNPDDYEAVEKNLKSAGADAFAYSRSVLASDDGTIHSDLMGWTKGAVRESLNPDDTHKTTSITIAIDVTGSGQRVPGIVRADLPQLMGLLSVQGYVNWPNIQIIGFGDATCDQYPLQVSQFEADIRIDECLRNLILEGGGGAMQTESYELVLYYAARRNKLESLARGEKGYLFLIGDELPYAKVDHNHVNQWILRDVAQKETRDIPFDQILAETLAKYHVFYIICDGSSYYNDNTVLDFWRGKLGGQHVIRLPKAEDISELIAALVGVQHGVTVEQIRTDLAMLGTPATAIDTITTHLTVAANSGAIKPSQPGSDRVERL